MAGFRSLVWALILSCAAIALAGAQQKVTTIQLPGGRNAEITFTTIDVPGAFSTAVHGINTNGDMVGFYSNTQNGPYHSFIYRGGTFTPFDYPGAISTYATGINDSGLIVGFNGGALEHGFSMMEPSSRLSEMPIIRPRFSAVQTVWRRGGDSNPRYPFRYVRFRGGSFQPLTHLSAPNSNQKCSSVIASL
jgi:probable HAF family extracellular repeat protein